MPISKNFSKSPFDIIHPKDRWRPDIDFSEENVQRFYAPFVDSAIKGSCGFLDVLCINTSSFYIYPFE